VLVSGIRVLTTAYCCTIHPGAPRVKEEARSKSNLDDERWCLQACTLLSYQFSVEREIMEGTNRPEDKSLTKGEPRKPTYVEVASRKSGGGR